MHAQAYCKSARISPTDGCGCGNVTITIGEIKLTRILCVWGLTPVANALSPDTAAGDKLSNGKYYHSMKFIHRAGIERFRNLTSQIQAGFPNAHIGANFAPTLYMTDPRDGQTYCLNYLGVTYQWLTLFREGGATLPWSEGTSPFFIRP
jgi:hypothetical protein